jgi:hypothetical protein
MQDHYYQFVKIFLLRTAGPYKRVKAEVPCEWTKSLNAQKRHRTLIGHPLKCVSDRGYDGGQYLALDRHILILKFRVVARTVPHKSSFPSDTA